jgi:amino acid adenylation domain-containing protein
VARQEVFRSRIETTADGPVLRIDPVDESQSADICKIVECATAEEDELWIDRFLGRPFALKDEWPIRLLLSRREGRGDQLMIVMHHVAVDGASAGLTVSELARLYNCGSSGQEPLAQGYLDLIASEPGSAAEQADDVAWWREHLAAAQPLQIMGIRPRRSVRSGRGGSTVRHLPASLTSSMRQLAAMRNSTLFVVLHSLATGFLSRITGQADISVGVPFSVRPPASGSVIGNFTQTVIMRADVRPSASVMELIGQSHDELAQISAHCSVGAAQLAADREIASSVSVEDLLRVLVNLDVQDELPMIDGSEIEWVDVEIKAIDHDLEFAFTMRTDGTLSLTLRYDADLFSRDLAGELIDHFLIFAGHAAAEPGRPVSGIELLEPRHQAELDGLAASGGRVDDCCAVCSFEAQAAGRPDTLALLGADSHDTYRSLQARAETLVSLLGRSGIRRDGPIAVVTERTPIAIATMLAVLKYGAIYLPLNTGDSVDRLRTICAAAGAVAVVNCVASFPAGQLADGIPVLDVTPGLSDPHAPAGPCAGDGFATADAGRSADDSQLAHRSRGAYLLFTSGTTGQPKGVLVTHGSLINRLAWARHHFQLGPADRHLQKAALDFDVSMAEILQPLVCGGTLVLAAPGTERSPDRVEAEARSNRVTIVHFVPSALRSFLSAGSRLPDTVRLVYCSGEALPADLAAHLLHTHPGLRLENTYGPTETTIEVSCQRADGNADAEFVSIGTPIWNSTMEVLDHNLERLPPFVVGELYIGGVQVSAGYLGQPGLTARSFGPDPYSQTAGSRLYASGDMGYRDLMGDLHFVERRDRQVKVRGSRVELGAVEAGLATHPLVLAAVATVEQRGAPGETLVAFVQAKAGISEQELRSYAARSMAHHFVPDRILMVDEIPLTSAGKLDRSAVARRLAATAGHDRRPAGLAASHDRPGDRADPREEVVSRIAWIMADMLNVAEVGPDDDFFELGGHSLLAAQVAVRLQCDLSLDVSPASLFDYPTARLLAQRFPVQAPGPARPVSRGQGSDPQRTAVFPLSRAQQRLWVAARSAEAGHDYDVGMGWLFTRVRQSGELLAAADKLVARHGILRTSYQTGVDGDRQVVHAGWTPARTVIDMPQAGATQLGQVLLRELRREPFDLTVGPPVRVGAGVSADGAVVVMNVHHIAVDGPSAPIVRQDLCRALAGALPGGEPPQYADFAVRDRASPASDLEAGLSYWKAQLGGAEELVLPGARTRPSADPGAGRLVLHVGPKVLEGVRRRVRLARTTMFCGILGTFASALSCLTGQRDLVIGTDAANRETPEALETVGFFTNKLPLRVRLDTDPSLSGVLEAARRSLIGGLRHQSVPFDAIVEELNPPRHGRRMPLIRANVVLHDAPEADDDAQALFDIDDEASAKYDLHMVWAPAGSGLDGVLEWGHDVLPDQAAEAFAESLMTCMATLADSDQTRLSELTNMLNNLARARARTGRQLRRTPAAEDN